MNILSTILRGNLFFFALLLAPAGMLLPAPVAGVNAYLLLLMALAEEIIFRAVVQKTLGAWMAARDRAERHARSGWRILVPSRANLVASALFSLLHLFSHPPLWAMAVFLPSLVYGILWDRYKSVLPCWIVHAAYNLAYFNLTF
jgi:membrane protease YdiL (CAAX protease family)